jgi:hypothetical protein
MVDEAAVLRIFQHYFEGTEEIIRHHLYSFDSQGRMTVHADVTREFLVPMPDGMWPIEFGRIDGDCNMDNCGLSTLDGSPLEVMGSLVLSDNPLKSLEGCTQFIGGRLLISNIEFESLAGLPPDHSVEISWYPRMPMLRLLTCKWIELPWHQMRQPADGPEKTALSILRKYRHMGKRGAIRCQKELIAAGLEGNAKW